MDEWISIEERLPDEKRPVLVTAGKDVSTAFITKHGDWYHPSGKMFWSDVTHWAEIKDLPKKKGC